MRPFFRPVFLFFLFTGSVGPLAAQLQQPHFGSARQSAINRAVEATEAKTRADRAELLDATGVSRSRDLYAATPEQKEKLLDKVRDAVTWFQSLETDARKRSILPDQYRRHVEPMEVMQSAVLLRKAKQYEMVDTVLSLFPYLQATPEECFEIEERLESEGLDTLGTKDPEGSLEVPEAENADPNALPESVRTVHDRAKAFLERALTPEERMILYEDPKTPKEMMVAAGLLAGGGRPPLTRWMLKKFNAEQPTSEECAEIVDAVGSSRLASMALDRTFAPHAEPAVRRVFAEARKFWNDPESIRAALDRLVQGGKADAATDIATVRRGAEVSVALMIDRFAEADEEEVAEIRSLLRSMGPGVKEALAESLRNPDGKIVRECAITLSGMVRDDEDAPLYATLYDEHLPEELRNEIATILGASAKVPDRDATVRRLYTYSLDYFERKRPIVADAEGLVELWNYDEQAGKLAWMTLPAQAAYRLYAYRYARDADRIAPDQPTVNALYLKTFFERAAYAVGGAGLDRSEADVPALLALLKERKGDAAQLEAILEDALQGGHFGAATVAATLLGEIGTAEWQCYVHSEKDDRNNGRVRPRPLVRATAALDRHVRFAALRSIMKLAPDKPYPGANLVVEALTWFARGEGLNRAVAAAPKHTDAMQLAGHLVPLGFHTDTALTGREAMRLAAETPDVEMLLIDVRCLKPDVRTLAQEMRADCRTCDIPLGLLGTHPTRPAGPIAPMPIDLQTVADRIAPDNLFAHALAVSYPMPTDGKTVRWIRDDLYLKTATRPVDPAKRLLQGRAALGWIRKQVDRMNEPGGVKIYEFEDLDNIAVRATGSITLYHQGVDLAASIRSARMQALLAEQTAQPAFTLEVRKYAADRFAESVRKHGVLLRGKQVQLLYDRYNATEGQPKEVQDLLAAILDAVENKVLGE